MENPNNPWISIQDSLPAEWELVICHCEQGLVAGLFLGDGIWSDDKSYEIKDVTYWMYLPWPPDY